MCLFVDTFIVFDNLSMKREKIMKVGVQITVRFSLGTKLLLPCTLGLDVFLYVQFLAGYCGYALHSVVYCGFRITERRIIITHLLISEA